MNNIEKIVDGIVYAGIGTALVISCGVLGKAIIDHAKPNPDDLSETVYIVQTDERSQLQAIPIDPYWEHADKAAPAFTLTDAERERVARIVAGQAADKSTTCQTMIANVLYNQMLTTGGSIQKTEYATCGTKKPTDATYEAVDAIFQRGEWLLDDTVLWTDNAENPDEWHQTLRLVTTCDGIAFYEVA